MKKIIYHSIFIFLSSFFAIALTTIVFTFLYFYQQVSLMSHLISVSQNEGYKIYIFLDKPVPTSNTGAYCLGKEHSDVKAMLYQGTPNIFNSNGYSLGVIGKIDNTCEDDELKKWEHITWKDSGVEIGDNKFFLDKTSFPSQLNK